MASPRRSRNAASSSASQLSSSSATRRRSSSGARGVVGTVLMTGTPSATTRIRLRPAVRGSVRRCWTSSTARSNASPLDGELQLLQQQVLRDGGHAGGGGAALAALELARSRSATRGGGRSASASSGTPGAVAGDGLQDRRIPRRPAGCRLSMLRSSETVRSASGRSALLTTCRSATSSRPGLDRLDVVAHAGHADHGDRVGGLHDVDLVLADADGLDDHDVAAARVEHGDRVDGRAARARRASRACDMLRTNTPSSSACSVIRMRSPRIEPPVIELLGSTATMPTVLSRARSSRDERVDERATCRSRRRR